jgi:hypothetical protein
MAGSQFDRRAVQPRLMTKFRSRPVAVAQSFAAAMTPLEGTATIAGIAVLDHSSAPNTKQSLFYDVRRSRWPARLDPSRPQTASSGADELTRR